jgi:hypothetical protein
MSGERQVAGGVKMKLKKLSVLILIVLCLSLMALVTPHLATPVRADPVQFISVSFGSTTYDPRPVNFRSHNIQSGDTVIQFTRPNLTVGANPVYNLYTVLQGTHTVWGDFNGTLDYETQWLDITWDGRQANTMLGYFIGRGTWNDGHGNTFSGIQCGDFDSVLTAPNTWTSTVVGYFISTSATGAFSGYTVIGTQTSTEVYDMASGRHDVSGTATLRGYTGGEISGPVTVNGTGTSGYGAMRSLGSSIGNQPVDEFVQFTRSNINITKGDPVSYIEGGYASGSFSGAFSGTYSNSFNSILIPGTSPTFQGWTAGKFTFSDGSGTVRGFFLNDELGFTSPGTQTTSGHMFALMGPNGPTGSYAGKDYYVSYTVSTSGGTTWASTGSLYTLTPSTYQVATATSSGITTFVPSSGTIENLASVSEGSLPSGGKPLLQFPHGFFSFIITGLSNGESVTLTITLPQAVPVGTQYWKYGPTTGIPTNHWYQIPMGSDNGDNVITITVTDGGLGDDDLTADGVIIDQGGPGNPPTPVAVGAPVSPNLYIGIAAALGAAVLGYLVRRKLVCQG